LHLPRLAIFVKKGKKEMAVLLEWERESLAIFRHVKKKEDPIFSLPKKRGKGGGRVPACSYGGEACCHQTCMGGES